jgi:glyoxylase-like metal-dependent hydrolase (beta-lactamase superfamily II)
MSRKALRKAAAAARSGLRRYPKEVLDSLIGGLAAQPPPVEILGSDHFGEFERSRLAAAWIGHATVLLRIGGPSGITVLTDPVFSSRIGLSIGRVTLGPARLRPAAFQVEQLPKIDLVLLSHAHFDHLDKPSLRRLAGPGGPAPVGHARRGGRPIGPGVRGGRVRRWWCRSNDLPNAAR